MTLKKKTFQPFIIGLTGGIGSGKSTVSQLLQESDHIPTIDTDDIARKLVAPHTKGLNAITKHFGEAILNHDNTLNRATLREIIFNNSVAKQQLESILHPMIEEEIQKGIEQLKQNSSPPIILVAIPLLAESIKKNGQIPSYLDQIWVVDTTIEQQLKQACQRDKSTPEQIQKIIHQQATRAERLAIADVIIHNTGNINHLKQQLQRALKLEVE
jgi:dephospho-CoA kinase